MELDTTASPADVADTHADSAAPVDVSTEASTATGGETNETQTDDGLSAVDDLLAPDEEFEEVDYEGAKYKVPKPLKEAVLRQADYTQKTMALAEQRRSVEAQAAQVAQAATFTQAEQQAAFQLHTLNTDIAALEALDWANLDGDDPDVRQAHWKLQQLSNQRDTLNRQLNEHLTIKQRNAQTAAQQEAAKEREQVDAVMSKKIKDWGPEKRTQLETFAVEQGIPADLAKNAGPAEFNLLRLAKIGAQAEQQRTAALKAAIKPANEVGASGGGSSDPSDMNMEQYKAWRAKQGD